jgi:hypothetical protein
LGQLVSRHIWARCYRSPEASGKNEVAASALSIVDKENTIIETLTKPTQSQRLIVAVINTTRFSFIYEK